MKRGDLLLWICLGILQTLLVTDTVPAYRLSRHRDVLLFMSMFAWPMCLWIFISNEYPRRD